MLTSGVIASAEIAIAALRTGQVTTIVQQHPHVVTSLTKLRGNAERLYATTHVASTLAIVTAATWAGLSWVSHLKNLYYELLGQQPALRPFAFGVAFVAIVAAVSFLFIICAALVPKSLALRSAPSCAVVLAPPLYLVSRLLSPMVWLATGAANLILRIFSDQTSFTETRLSVDELAHLVHEAARGGSIHPKAGEIAVRALDFGNVVIGEVMVPRTRIAALSTDATTDEVRRVLLEENHAHFPVYNGTLDDIVGVVSTNDVLALAWERELFVLHDLLRPPHFVPETMRAADALGELQRERVHFAVVVDERGGTAGIVTLKDLIEELVGKLLRHNDQPSERVRPQPDGSYLVPGNMPVRDANRELPFVLPEGEDFATVGGLVSLLAGRLALVGERFVTEDGITLEVIDASPRRIRTVRVDRAPDNGS